MTNECHNLVVSRNLLVFDGKLKISNLKSSEFLDLRDLIDFVSKVFLECILGKHIEECVN